MYRARQEASWLWITATQELVAARAEGKQMQEQAGMKARVLQTQADNLLLNASREAARIVDTANQRAEEIADEALAAARNAAGLKRLSRRSRLENIRLRRKLRALVNN